jgi:hypothetical protein
METRILIGRKEITNYTGRCWPTVERWVDKHRFPARKLDGVWTSKADMIDIWLQERIDLADMATR